VASAHDTPDAKISKPRIAEFLSCTEARAIELNLLLVVRQAAPTGQLWPRHQPGEVKEGNDWILFI
jgi:hypothetical protein